MSKELTELLSDVLTEMLNEDLEEIENSKPKSKVAKNIEDMVNGTF